MDFNEETTLKAAQSIPDYCDRSVKILNIKRGDIYFADLRPGSGFRAGRDTPCAYNTE